MPAPEFPPRTLFLLARNARPRPHSLIDRAYPVTGPLARSPASGKLVAMDSVRSLDGLFRTLFQAHPWHGIAPCVDDERTHAFIEIVPTDPVKYELDKDSGHLSVDRPQRFSSLCPTLYGFIPQTYCGERVGAFSGKQLGESGIRGDGDPLDICVLTEKGFAHGNFLCAVRVIGGLRVIDGNEADDKIIAVLDGDIAFGKFATLADCPKPIVDRLEHYFLTYKQRPGAPPPHVVRVAARYDRDEALEVVRHSIDDYEASFGTLADRLGALRKLLAGP